MDKHKAFDENQLAALEALGQQLGDESGESFDEVKAQTDAAEDDAVREYRERRARAGRQFGAEIAALEAGRGEYYMVPERVEEAIARRIWREHGLPYEKPGSRYSLESGHRRPATS